MCTDVACKIPFFIGLICYEIKLICQHVTSALCTKASLWCPLGYALWARIGRRTWNSWYSRNTYKCKVKTGWWINALSIWDTCHVHNAGDCIDFSICEVFRTWQNNICSMVFYGWKKNRFICILRKQRKALNNAFKCNLQTCKLINVFKKELTAGHSFSI